MTVDGFQSWAVPLAQIAAAAATFAVAYLTFHYVRATREMVAEMRTSRENAEQPFVVAYADEFGGTIAVIVENAGNGPAYDLVVRPKEGSSAPTWRMGGQTDGPILDLNFLPAKGRSQRAVDFMSLGMDPGDYPPIQVVCTYKDRFGTQHESSAWVEVAPLIDVRRKGLHDVADAVDKVERELRDIRHLLERRRA
jgi:hypothetical protein